MAKQKGTNIVALRKLFKERGEQIEITFLQKLDSELEGIYKTALTTTMTPVEKQTAIYTAAAKTLFPDRENPLHYLGLELANRSYTGIYRLFLKIPTPQFVISRAAAIWGTYYDKGHGDVELITEKSADFILRDIPELPLPALDYIGGHAVKLLELAGAKNVTVKVAAGDPDRWRWKLKWI